jgi:hypothetical protein
MGDIPAIYADVHIRLKLFRGSLVVQAGMYLY